MRALLSFLASVMLFAGALGGAVQAGAHECSGAAEQVAVHVAGDCDEVPADADRGYPHCHTGCHGVQVAVPVPSRLVVTAVATVGRYLPVAQPMLSSHQGDQTLRPPRA